MAIDLGSTAKGYTSNTLINILKEHNVKSALKLRWEMSMP